MNFCEGLYFEWCLALDASDIMKRRLNLEGEECALLVTGIFLISLQKKGPEVIKLTCGEKKNTDKTKKNECPY